MTILSFDRWLEQRREVVELVKGRVSGDGTLYERMNAVQGGFELAPTQETLVQAVADAIKRRGVKPDDVAKVMYQNYVEVQKSDD